MYTVATHLLEKLTQSSFSSLLQWHIFDKLNMTSTFLQPSKVYAAKQADRFSKPYYFKDGFYHETEHQEVPEAQGSGSIQTSAKDFAKFIQSMISRSGPITDAIYEAVTRPRIMRNPKANLAEFGPESSETAYALGWDVKYYRQHQMISHDGMITGYGSRMFMMPGKGIGAMIIGNSDAAFHLSSIIQNEMINVILDVPEIQQLDIASKRLARFTAQTARRQQNIKRNVIRRLQARNSHTTPIVVYCGTYHNEAYHSLKVEERNGELLIDASDRSMPFTMSLEHLSGDTKFRGYLTELDGREDIVPVTFRFDSEGKVTAIGIAFEEELGDHYLFWFTRI